MRKVFFFLIFTSGKCFQYEKVNLLFKQIFTLSPKIAQPEKYEGMFQLCIITQSIDYFRLIESHHSNVSKMEQDSIKIICSGYI